ncbi:MAG: phage holin family protein [Pseudomonadota bacterium]|nr:phage holin family protein [Pseudomonadota bacterium]
MARTARSRWAARLLAPLLRGLQEGVLALDSRWELARLEWGFERGRLLQSVAGLALLAVAGLLALVFAGLATVVTWWDTDHRVMVAWLVCGAFAAMALVGLFMWRFAEMRKERRFAALRAELAADRDWIARQLRRGTESDG